MGIPVTGCVGLNSSRCQFDQLFGVGKASNRGLSKMEDCISGKTKPLPNKLCGSALDGSDAIV